MKRRKTKQRKPDAIQLKIIGIKCDACDYQEPSVPFDAYSSYIGRPCPKCGANLLTETDYQRAVRLIKAASCYNRVHHMLFDWIPHPFRKEPKNIYKMRIDFPHQEDNPRKDDHHDTT